jgi:hypothetical protein
MIAVLNFAVTLVSFFLSFNSRMLHCFKHYEKKKKSKKFLCAKYI